MISLHWFRSDLRLHDNRALAAACAEGAAVAIYIATPRQWQEHDDAPIKQDYWRRALHALEPILADLNVPLHYFEVPSYAEIPALLERVLAAWQVSALHCNREYPLNEHRRDEAVRAACGRLGVRFTVHDDQVLLAPEAVTTRSGEPFKVFTPFARRMREMLDTAGIAQAARLQRQNPLGLPRVKESCELRELSWPAMEPQWESWWPADEEKVRRQLAAFCKEKIAAYPEQRNIPALRGTSRLSPALAAGVVSVRECWLKAAQWHDGEGMEAWRNELLWRDFYKHVTWHWPRVSKGYNWRADYGHVPWRHDEREFGLWCEGRTGIPIIDAAMRQLAETGWMHNRLRMLSATFLTKHLLIDWRWGEAWFMRHLVDGDFGANNGGWQWSASTGTDAAPYFRVFNPVTQSRRYDPEGKFIRHYLPELAELDDDAVHEPGLLRPQEYPAPMIDLAFGRERALNAFKTRD